MSRLSGFDTDRKIEKYDKLYNVACNFSNGYIATVFMNGRSKNLYLVNNSSTVSVDSYLDDYCIGDVAFGLYTVLKGHFTISVSDVADMHSRTIKYLISGSFQLPVKKR